MAAYWRVDSLAGDSFSAKFKRSISHFLSPINFPNGFSLMEILVGVGIITLLTSVAIPNLRSFLKQQEIDNASLQVLSALKTAQSSAQSRIKCPNGQVSDTWIVRLTSGNYSLISKCQTGPDQNIYTKLYAPSSAETLSTFSGTLDVCNGATTDIIFSKNQVTYLCSGQLTAQTGTVRLTLTSSASNLNKIVRIESGGILKIE